jgi:biopolymer transport protein ExbB
MSQLLAIGGPLTWLLLGGFILVLGILCERLSYFHRANLNVSEFMSGVASLVRRKNYAEALHECLSTGVPVGRVMHAALLRPHAPRDELKQIVQEAGQLEVPKLEQNLSIVHGVAHAAPLVGLLGSFVHLIDNFIQLSRANAAASPLQLATGIYGSLTSTALGLAVAIPALLFYLLLNAKARHLMNDLERAGIEIVNLLMDAREDSSILSFASSASVQAAAANPSPAEVKPAPASTPATIVDGTAELKNAKRKVGSRSSG